MKIQKSNLTVDGNHVHMSMPFAKVDKEKRLVSGYATLDNIDTQGDVVLAEASAAAFARARGNLREMHDKVAVGKVVDFKEDEFFDQETNKFYRGIFVTAYVSKGAQNTWEKVLDGTLTGFSIGGEVNDSSDEFVKEAGRSIRFIKDYDLVELSLVDNPANQLANVKSFQKVLSFQKDDSGEMTVKGMAVETKVETVFICTVDETVIVKDSESEDCPVCESKMENAGWFESGTNRAEKVGDIVNKFLSPSVKEDAPISEGEGGVEMSDKEKKVEEVEVEETEATAVEEVVEQEEVEETETVDEAEGTEEEGAESPEEVVDEETEISKKIDELHEAVKESLEKSAQDNADKVGELEKKIDEATQAFLSKASELETRLDGFGNKIEATKSRLAELETSLEKMNDSDALKKSAEVGESRPAVQTKNDAWNGAFSGKPSRFSVDDL